MDRLHNIVEVENATRPRCVSTILTFIGFAAGCLLTMSIITIIAYATGENHGNCSSRKINPLEPLNIPIYVSWDSIELPIFDDNTSSVCFDYDDTIAFTTLTFQFAKNISGDSIDQMWDIVNNERVGERLSINKNITSLILRRYVNRSPNSPIRIIAARCSASPELITRDEANIKRQILKIIPNAKNLIVHMLCNKMSEGMTKMNIIQYYGCRVMFGDSDDDIQSCILSSDCSPLRILRSANSTFNSENNPGLFHEPIVSDSYY